MATQKGNPQSAKGKTPTPRTLRQAAASPASVITSVGVRGTLPPFFSNVKLQGFLLFAFAFLLYANTLGHGFVQDDDIVIRDNMFTKQGVSGIPGILSKDTFFGFFKVEGKANLVAGGRYRPLTLVFFAVVYQIFGESTFAFHLLTVLLFALTCLVLYRVLFKLFEPNWGAEYAAVVSWITALIFAAHPIHTEVVCNIKGCDEIVTLLGSLGALWFVLRAHDSGESKWGWLAAGVFFLACLSKENAVTFLAVVPLALWVFRGASAGAVVRHTWPLLVGFAIFLAIRFSILGINTGKPLPELMNDPFLKQVGSGWAPFSPAEKFATVFFTLGKYVLLLLVPHPLTHDYYPRQIGILNFGNPGALLSLLLYIGLAAYGFSGLKKRDPLRFGIVFFLLTLSLVSNLVISIGTNMAERFLFMPSVGFCLAVAVLLTNLLRRDGTFDVSKLTTPLLVAGVVAALFSLKTILRNPAWESNEKLFFTDVATSRNSAKIHNACGGVLADKANVERDPALRERMATQAVGHLDTAILIYKDYSDAFASRGKANAILSNFDKSVADYREAVRLKPNDPNMIRSLAIVLRDGGRYYGQQKKDLNTARKMFEESWKINPKDPQTAMNLGTANGLAGDAAAAIAWFQRAVDLEPTNASSIFDLATAYAQAGDINKANELYAKAQQLDPQIAQKKRGGQ